MRADQRNVGGWVGRLRAGAAGRAVLRAMRVLLAVVLGLGFSGASVGSVDDGLVPSASGALAAYAVVDAWVREMEVGELDADTAARIGSISGVSVTIRDTSGVVGRGTAFGDGSLSRAAGDAIAEALERVSLPPTRDRDTALGLVMASARVSVEIGGDMVPIQRGLDSWGDVGALVSHGLEGVAVRAGGKTEGVFPSLMVMARRDAGSTVAGVVSRMLGDPLAAAKLPGDVGVGGEGSAVRLFRFGVAHAAQARAGGSPVVLHRGGRVVKNSDLDRAALIAWADGMARWLLERGETVEPGGALGVYDPFSGSWRAGRGGGDGDDVVAAALARYASVRGVDARLSKRARSFTDELAERRGLGEDVVRPWARWWGDGLLRGGDAELREDVRARFVAAGAGRLVNEMPWLGFDELLVSDRLQRVPSARALRAMRGMMWSHMLGARDVRSRDVDLLGGIVFTTRANPVPDWQSARPLAFVAAMLGDPRLTDGEVFADELTELLAAVRFLRQLTVGDAEAHAYRDPLEAAGGVRASLSDHSMPAEATAYTLLCVSELLASLEAVSGR